MAEETRGAETMTERLVATCDGIVRSYLSSRGVRSPGGK